MERPTARDAASRPPGRQSLSGDERGAHAVEYIMIVGLVAMVALAGARFYGNRVQEKAEQQGRCVKALSCDEPEGPYRLVEMGAPGPAPAGKLMSAMGDLAQTSLMKMSAFSKAPVAYAGELERPPLLPAPEGGLDKNRFGVVLNDDPTLLPTGAQLAALGVTSARITLNQGNFTESDQNLADWRAKLEDYRANRIDVVINTPRELAAGFPEQPAGWQWHNGADPGDWREKFTAWKDGEYMRRLDVAVKNLGPYAHGFEVWNEPDELNNRSDYAPALPADEYGKLLRDAWNKIQAGPDGPGGRKPLVITAGLDSGQPPYLEKAVEATGGVLYADAIGLHPYAKHPHLPEDDQNSLKKILGEYTRAKFTTPNSQGAETALPVYVTEASQPSPDHEDVRTYTNNAAVVAGTTPGVAKTYFFWNKTSDDHPGLVEYPKAEPGQPRPPGVPTPGYQQLAGLLGQQCAPGCTIP